MLGLHTLVRPGTREDNAMNLCVSFSLLFLSAITWSFLFNVFDSITGSAELVLFFSISPSAIVVTSWLLFLPLRDLELGFELPDPVPSDLSSPSFSFVKQEFQLLFLGLFFFLASSLSTTLLEMLLCGCGDVVYSSGL